MVPVVLVVPEAPVAPGGASAARRAAAVDVERPPSTLRVRLAFGEAAEEGAPEGEDVPAAAAAFRAARKRENAMGDGANGARGADDGACTTEGQLHSSV